MDSDAEMNKGARAFMEYVEKEIGSCILYSFGNFYRDHIDKSLLKDFAYWHARYASSPINEKLEDLFAWQHTDKGSVAGISSPVDLDKSGGSFFLNPKKSAKKGGKYNMDKGTIARTAVLLVALANQFLTIFGWNPLPWSENEVYTGVTGF